MSASHHPPAPAAEPLRWVKADLHLHTSEDPFDEVDYSARELVDRAAGLGFRVLAVTLHQAVFDDPAVFAHAAERGILLIRGAELRIEGADVVVLNISREEGEAVRSFEDLRRLRAERGASVLVFAPHPFYRLGGSIGARIEGCLNCFDAIEHCHFHLPGINPNRPAAALARRTGKPLLATSDSHQLKFFGQHFSWLGLRGPENQVPTPAEVFESIREGRIRQVAPTGGWRRLVALLCFIFVLHPLLARLPGSKRNRRRAAGAPALGAGHPNSIGGQATA